MSTNTYTCDKCGCTSIPGSRSMFASQNECWGCFVAWEKGDYEQHRMEAFLEKVEGDTEFYSLLEEVVSCKVFHIDRFDGYTLMRLKDYIERNMS